MLKSRIAKGFAALALLSAMAAPVFAAEVTPAAPVLSATDGKPGQPPEGGKGGPRGGFHGGGPFKDLDLTAEQKAKIEAIHKAHGANERQEIDAVLTPEQLAKLKAKMAEHREHRRGGQNGEQPPAQPAE